jgi:hypothetical protein
VSQFASRFGGQIPGGALTNFIPVQEQVSNPTTGTVAVHVLFDTADKSKITDKSRPILSAERTLGSVIKLLTPAEEYSDEYNAWLAQNPLSKSSPNNSPLVSFEKLPNSTNDSSIRPSASPFRSFPTVAFTSVSMIVPPTFRSPGMGSTVAI